ncbi:MAG: SdrD B-like domain-containing protein [Tepidisphaeraceae bacterium]
MFNQTAPLDPKFGGDGLVTTSFGGGNERAFAAVAQTDGKFFVTGKTEFTGANSERSVFARYLPDGSLNKTFSGDGKLVLSADQAAKFGLVSGAYQLPSGSYLLSASNGVFRMKPDGTIDSGFGTNGKVDVGAAQIRINSDGSFRTYSYDGQYNTPALWNSQGKIVGTYGTKTYGRPILLDDGNVLIVGYDQRLTLYTADMKKVKSFGISGDTYLQGVFDKFLRDGRAWYDTNGNKLSYLPAVNITTFSKTRDGGYLVSATIYGQSDKHVASYLNTGVVTFVTVKLDAAGNYVGFIDKTNAYGYSTDNRTTVDYRPNPGQFAGNLLFGVGDGIHFEAQYVDGQFIQGGSADAVKTPSGAYVMFGSTITQSTSANGGQFTIALTKKVTQSISGTLFNDNNRNGVYDAGDTLNPGRTVYIDENDNEKLDVGEPTVLTDANGKYTFTNLGVGEFHIRRVFPDSTYYYTSNYYKIFLTTGIDGTVDLGSYNTKLLKDS